MSGAGIRQQASLVALAASRACALPHDQTGAGSSVRTRAFQSTGARRPLGR